VRWLDWVVLAATLGGIIVYGAWRGRQTRDAAEYLRAAKGLSWPTIGLAVMATQASAITFLSTPGLAFEDGMGFVQFYFGLPIALVVVAAVFVPIFYRLKVYTAYEYLEQRFDVRVRLLGALLFLTQRGLAAGITIYAPAIILSTIMDWPLRLTTLVMGAGVIVYTVGGAKVVNQTGRHQMVVILLGMFAAGWFLVRQLPADLSLDDAASLAGAAGRMRIVDTRLRFDTRYTLWSGLAGGFFLALSYFGTDQSQVGRYLGGQSSATGRLGLLFNGVFKIPMQFLILFLGVLLYVFYLFAPQPAFFNPDTLAEARSRDAPALEAAEASFASRVEARREAAHAFVAARRHGTADVEKARFAAADADVAASRKSVKELIVATVPGAQKQDADFVFITFVLSSLPAGLVGLLIAVILCAAMSSIAAELNALATTSAVDLYKRLWRRDAGEEDLVRATRFLTIGWGLVAVGFAAVANLFDNLIEAVNVLGSLFYGTILGLFVVGFFFKGIGARAVFWAGLTAQTFVLTAFFTTDIGFLWFNAIGCAIVVGVGALLERAGTSYGTQPAPRA
jgi:Na+/proline symporter